MKWVEIITLRAPSRIHTQFLDELLKETGKSDAQQHLVEIRIYHHSVVSTICSGWTVTMLTSGMAGGGAACRDPQPDVISPKTSAPMVRILLALLLTCM